MPLSKRRILGLISSVISVIVIAGTFRVDHLLNADGTQDSVPSVLGVPVEALSQRNDPECPAHTAYAEGRETPLLLSRCYPQFFSCVRYEREFYEQGCGG